ncbi:MAG: hypothetical protein HC917_23080, partial [Richelia sp. SM2_1_7]|nr:hypothetical protein [Richelia sp. SM2_1_7]
MLDRYLKDGQVTESELLHDWELEPDNVDGDSFIIHFAHEIDGNKCISYEIELRGEGAVGGWWRIDARRR